MNQDEVVKLIIGIVAGIALLGLIVFIIIKSKGVGKNTAEKANKTINSVFQQADNMVKGS